MREDLLNCIRKSFRSVFDVEPETVTLDTQPTDIKGWDSMGHVTLASSLEQEFKVSFDVDELMEMENVKEIVRILEAKLATA